VVRSIATLAIEAGEALAGVAKFQHLATELKMLRDKTTFRKMHC